MTAERQEYSFDVPNNGKRQIFRASPPLASAGFCIGIRLVSGEAKLTIDTLVKDVPLFKGDTVVVMARQIVEVNSEGGVASGTFWIERGVLNPA